MTAETHPEDGGSLQLTEINGEFQKFQERTRLPVIFKETGNILDLDK